MQAADAWMHSVHIKRLWPALLEAAVLNFLRNDLHHAVVDFVARSKGSFGIAAQVCTLHDDGHACLFVLLPAFPHWCAL